jgi:hypothetical protein
MATNTIATWEEKEATNNNNNTKRRKGGLVAWQTWEKEDGN